MKFLNEIFKIKSAKTLSVSMFHDQIVRLVTQSEALCEAISIVTKSVGQFNIEIGEQFLESVWQQ